MDRNHLVEILILLLANSWLLKKASDFIYSHLVISLDDKLYYLIIYLFFLNEEEPNGILHVLINTLSETDILAFVSRWCESEEAGFNSNNSGTKVYKYFIENCSYAFIFLQCVDRRVW